MCRAWKFINLILVNWFIAVLCIVHTSGFVYYTHHDCVWVPYMDISHGYVL